MKTIIIGSGLLITLLIILFKLGETQFIKGNVRMEVIIAITSVIFFVTGIYFNRKNVKKGLPPPEQITEHPQLFIDKKFLQTQPDANGLTKRELEVLQKMGEGFSNHEIAGALFLSESTIKTHVSNILFKLDAKRRTEAVKIARERGII